MIRIVQVISILLLAAPVHATKVNAYYYLEVQPGGTQQQLRYIVNNRYLRIDDGKNSSDFVLLDRQQKKMHSIVHDNHSITTFTLQESVVPSPLRSSVATLARTEKQQDDLPVISDRQAYQYVLYADNKVCMSSVNIVHRGDQSHYMLTEALKLYHSILGSYRRLNYFNTPLELHDFCESIVFTKVPTLFLEPGLPIQWVFPNGSSQILLNFKLEAESPQTLFDIPQYTIYNL